MAKRARRDPFRNVDGRRKGRGLAKKTKLWGKTKLNIIFNEYGQACGGDKDKLASQLGVFAKDGDNFPLTSQWKKMEPAVLDNIWNDVLDNTNAPPEYRRFCIASLARQWKDWKYNIRGIYTDLKTDEARLANCPESVCMNQWVELVSLWGSAKSKKESDVNKKNRSKLDFLPRTGKKSHCQIIKQRQDEGKPVDRVSVFIATRTNEAGETLDLTTKHMIDTLNEAVEELPEEERNSPSKREQIFTNTLGKDNHGRLRCMGLGLTRSMVFGKASNAEDVAAVRAELEEKLESQRIAFDSVLARRLEEQKDAQEAEFSRLLSAQKEAQQAELAMCLNAQKEAQEAEISRRLNAQNEAQEAFQRKLLRQLQAANPGIVFQPF